MRFISLLRRKEKEKDDQEQKKRVAAAALPPPVPNIRRTGGQILQPASCTPDGLGRRNVLFRDNRLPDGSQCNQVMQRWQQSICDGFEAGRASPTPSMMSASQQNLSSLASYPPNYTPTNGLGNYDTPRGFIAPLQRHPIQPIPDSHFNSKKEKRFGTHGQYDQDLPSPDYPTGPTNGSANSNKDSGLDSDSRSSSGAKQAYSPEFTAPVSSYGSRQGFGNSCDHFGLPTANEHQSRRPCNNESNGANNLRSCQRVGSESVIGPQKTRPCQYTHGSSTYLEKISRTGISNQEMSRATSLTNLSKLSDFSRSVGGFEPRRANKESVYRTRERGLQREESLQRHCSSCSCSQYGSLDRRQFSPIQCGVETPGSTMSSTLRRTLLHSEPDRRAKNPSFVLSVKQSQSSTDGTARMQALKDYEDTQNDNASIYQREEALTFISSTDVERQNEPDSKRSQWVVKKNPMSRGLPRSQPMRVLHDFNSSPTNADDRCQAKTFSGSHHSSEDVSVDPESGSEFQEYSASPVVYSLKPTPSVIEIYKNKNPKEAASFVRI